MKAELISKPKVFEPFTVQVTFESREEALSMFARLNISGGSLAARREEWDDIKVDSDQVIVALQSDSSNHPLWSSLGQVVFQQLTGIKE